MTVLRADLRAFVAAMRKELRLTRRYPTLLLSVLFWPVLLPSAYVLMGRAYSGGDHAAIGAFAERSGTADVAGFVFVGFFMYMWLSNVLWGPGTALRQEQLRGSLESLFLTPASRLVILFGPSTSVFIPMALNFLVMGLALWLLFGVLPSLASVLSTLALLALSVPAMYGIGSLFSAAVLRFGEVNAIVQLVRGVFVLACGVSFPLVMLPAWAQAVGMVLPPTHIVYAGRLLLLEDVPLSRVAGQIALTLGLGLVICSAAVLVFRWTERSAQRSGMLGRF